MGDYEKSRIDYLVANGNHCIEYLKTLIDAEEDPALKNRIINHSLAVYAVCEEARRLYRFKVEIAAKNKELSAELANLKKGIYAQYVNAEVEKIKQGLIDHIMEY